MSEITKDLSYPKCGTCTSWKNKQAELGYCEHYGICTCDKWGFHSLIEGDVVVLDRKNISNKKRGVQRFEYQKNNIPIGDVEKSQYCLVTEETFGCVHHISIELLRKS